MSYPFGHELYMATEKDTKGRWSGGKPGERFRCGLCGHRIQLGERWRAVMANGAGSPCRHGNFLVCSTCHTASGGNDTALLRQRALMEKEADERFWWVRRP